jgi:spermidine/putrescine-binding protein
MKKLRYYSLSLLTVGAAFFCAIAPAQAADKKPNILVIWGDDIGAGTGASLIEDFSAQTCSEKHI